MAFRAYMRQHQLDLEHSDNSGPIELQVRGCWGLLCDLSWWHVLKGRGFSVCRCSCVCV